MSDDENNRGFADAKRINVNERYEVTFWTAALGVSEKKLRETVDKVGVMAADVRKELGRA